MVSCYVLAVADGNTEMTKIPANAENLPEDPIERARLIADASLEDDGESDGKDEGSSDGPTGEDDGEGGQAS